VEKRKAFKKRLQEKGIIVAPGVYDALSAKLVQHMGFEALYATGAGVAASLLGEPDVGLVTMSEQVAQVRHIAIHIEDQVMPKRCGHLEGVSVISQEEMVQKLRAAAEAREDKNFIIIARTDARSVYGLEAALERGKAYIEAGADVIFIEAPTTIEELKVVVETFRGIPLLLNRGGKKTPLISAAEAEDLGFKIVIFPGDLQRTAAKAMLDTLKVLKKEGNTISIQKNVLSFDERFELLGIKKYYEMEARSLSRDKPKPE